MFHRSNTMGERSLSSPHDPGLTGDTRTGGLVQALGLDDGQGYIAVEEAVSGHPGRRRRAVPSLASVAVRKSYLLCPCAVLENTFIFVV